MHDISTIAQHVAADSRRGCVFVEPAKLPSLAGLDEAGRVAVEGLVNRLFRQIRDNRPAWRQAWATTAALESAKLQWLAAFVENGIHDWDRQIELGLRRLREDESDFVPSPGKFIAWCRPTAEMLGLPSDQDAWREAVNGCADPERWRWSHEAVRTAAESVGFWELRQGDGGTDSLRRRFAAAYGQVLNRVARGEPVSPPVRVLECDDARSAAELADRAAEQALQERLRRDGLADRGMDARSALLAGLGIKRGVPA